MGEESKEEAEDEAEDEAANDGAAESGGASVVSGLSVSSSRRTVEFSAGARPPDLAKPKARTPKAKPSRAPSANSTPCATPKSKRGSRTEARPESRGREPRVQAAPNVNVVDV